MLGRQHLLLSLATSSVLLMPFIENYNSLALLFFIGSSIGALIPDVDASDAAVFHRNVKGLNGQTGKMINGTIGPLLPIFGYSTKYLIYKPAVHFFNLVSRNYNFHQRHRSFSHSLLGITTMTALTGIYVTPLLLYANIFSILHLTIFLSGYTLGAILHIIQDSCTKTGIAWNAPFSTKRLKGKLRTGKDNLQPRVMLYILTAQTLTAFYFSITNYLTFWRLLILTFTTPALSWSIFVFVVSKAQWN